MARSCFLVAICVSRRIWRNAWQNKRCRRSAVLPYLLIEFPPQIIPHYTSRLIFDLRQQGLIPIITHPERYAYFARDFTGLNVLREQGCMFQLTAMSLTKERR